MTVCRVVAGVLDIPQPKKSLVQLSPSGACARDSTIVVTICKARICSSCDSVLIALGGEKICQHVTDAQFEQFFKIFFLEQVWRKVFRNASFELHSSMDYYAAENALTPWCFLLFPWSTLGIRRRD